MQTNDFKAAVDAIVASDSRYDPEAYAFLRSALEFTLKKDRKSRPESGGDVSAAELLDGFRLYALREYGPMAKTVLEYWGVRGCEDIGNLVFHLVEASVFSKTDRDTLDDFRSGYDFDQAFLEPFRPASKRLSNPGAGAVQRGS